MLQAQLVPTSSEWRRSLKTNGREVRHYAPHPTPPPPNTQESNLPKRSKYERRNARSVPAPGKSGQAIRVTITACRVKSKNVANVSYLPRFLASPNLSRRGPDPAGSGKHCKIVPVNEPACRVRPRKSGILEFWNNSRVQSGILEIWNS